MCFCSIPQCFFVKINISLWNMLLTTNEIILASLGKICNLILVFFGLQDHSRPSFTKADLVQTSLDRFGNQKSSRCHSDSPIHPIGQMVYRKEKNGKLGFF